MDHSGGKDEGREGTQGSAEARAVEILMALAPDPKQRVGLVFLSTKRRGRPLSHGR